MTAKVNEAELVKEIAVSIVEDFADSMTHVDLSSHNTMRLFLHLEGLVRIVIEKAEEAKLSEVTTEATIRYVMMLFWRWIGRCEGWNLKELGGRDPHKVFGMGRGERAV